MANAKLGFTAVSAGGSALEIEFPLHHETRSVNQVAELLSAVLAALSEVIDRDKDVSDGDVLQALAMAAAIRCGLVDVPPSLSRKLLDQLLDDAIGAVGEARRSHAGRA